MKHVWRCPRIQCRSDGVVDSDPIRTIVCEYQHPAAIPLPWPFIANPMGAAATSCNWRERRVKHPAAAGITANGCHAGVREDAQPAAGICSGAFSVTIPAKRQAAYSASAGKARKSLVSRRRC